MSIDLGDTYDFAEFVTDDLGAPVDATSVVLTVVLPDGTSVLPAVVHGATGTYTASLPLTQPGRHVGCWTGTVGPKTIAQPDVFNVMPADPGFIISLDDARAALGTVAANTVKDEDLRSFIASATQIMENICGPILRATRIETYDGGSRQIVLHGAPIISITNVVESYGASYQHALTAQSIFGAGSGDAFGYTVDLDTGVLTRRSSGVASAFAAGLRNIQVTYVCGRPTIGANLLLATRLLVRQLWLVSGQQGFRPGVGGTPGPSGIPVGFAVPNAVLELCADDTRPPGLA